MKKEYDVKNTILTIVFLIIFLCGNFKIKAQCATLETPESRAYFEELRPQFQKYVEDYNALKLERSSTALNSIPIKAHILRLDDGSGGLSVGELNDAIAVANTYFTDAFLEFFLCGDINYIDDSNFYDYTSADGTLTDNDGYVENVINVYFVNSFALLNGQSFCGLAIGSGPSDPFILMVNSCTSGENTFTHELGHYFGLPHTHDDPITFLSTELVDGSNCTTAGDLFCDTPADPLLSTETVSENCMYIGNETDVNGQFYSPDPTNIMSYSRKGCRNTFTQEQNARMFAYLKTVRSNLSCPSFNVDISANYERFCGNNLEVSFNDNSSLANSWLWDIDGDDIIDYTTQNFTHIYDNEDSFDVTLTISDGTQSITKTFFDFIVPGGEIINTSEIVLSLFTDSNPEEISWEFKDDNNTVLYSSPSYTSEDAFSNFNETFNLNFDRCYTFEINDTGGDGICCNSGIGSLTLTTLEGDIIINESDFQLGTKVFIENGVVLSTNNFFSENPVTVYPNPTSELLNIKLSNANNLPISYSIYNMLGQVILSKTNAQNTDLTIDVSNYNNGVYFLKLKKGQNQAAIPFVKN